MGSKNRHAFEILNAIREDLGGSLWNWNEGKVWVEPFVGGANMIDKTRLLFKRRIGNDLNQYLIRMWQALQKGWFPPDIITEERYNQLKRNSECFIDNYEAPLMGFVGIGCSYSGQWFGTYARGKNSKGIERNYCLESRNNVIKQVKEIGNVEFYGGEYHAVPLPEKSLIYCDPPHKGTYNYATHFDTDRFWKWCDEKVAEGHKVYVSEFVAPDGWRCIWQKNVQSPVSSQKKVGTMKKNIEKLFTK